MTSRPASFRIWLAAARPRTLPAAVAPVLVGSALAWNEQSFVAPAAAACLVFALLVQIGTNFANDYYDFVKGADAADRVGPKRAVAAGWVAPRVMRTVMLAVFAMAFTVGLTLLQFGGWPLLVIGVASIICGIAYTGGPYPLGYHGLGDLFVFIFFGLVAVGATVFVQTGQVDLDALLAGAGVGLLAANILVVNNYRDVETDARAGKRTLVVRWGRRYARWQFGLSHALALTVPAALAARGTASPAGAAIMIGVLAPLAFLQLRTLRTAKSPSVLIALLGRTGQYVALYAVVLSLWLIWDR